MKTALVIGASGGIGRAVSARLKAQGVAVRGLSRRLDGFDLTDPETVERKLSALQPEFDLIFVATGALVSTAPHPEKSLRHLTAQEMAAQFAINCIGPALVLQHAARLMPRDRPAVFAALSARVGSIGDNRAGGWYSYRTSKAALNQVIRTGAIELGRSHRQSICVALHPGTVDTDFTAGYRAEKIRPETAALQLMQVIEELKPQDSGGFFDWAGKPVPW